LNCVSKRLQRVTQWMSCTFSVAGSAVSSSQLSCSSLPTWPKTRRSQVARSVDGKEPACNTGHFSVRYWPGGRRAGSKPASWTFCSALERKSGIAPYTSCRGCPDVTERRAAACVPAGGRARRSRVPAADALERRRGARGGGLVRRAALDREGPG